MSEVDKDEGERDSDVGKDLMRPEHKEEGEGEDLLDVDEGSSLEKQSMAERLLAISSTSSDREKVEARGKWLNSHNCCRTLEGPAMQRLFSYCLLVRR